MTVSSRQQKRHRDTDHSGIGTGRYTISHLPNRNQSLYCCSEQHILVHRLQPARQLSKCISTLWRSGHRRRRLASKGGSRQGESAESVHGEIDAVSGVWMLEYWWAGSLVYAKLKMWEDDDEKEKKKKNQQSREEE